MPAPKQHDCLLQSVMQQLIDTKFDTCKKAVKNNITSDACKIYIYSNLALFRQNLIKVLTSIHLEHSAQLQQGQKPL